MFKRYPHSAKIEWTGTGTYTTLGVYAPGTSTSITLTCNVQPGAGRYNVNEKGDRVAVALTVFSPLVTATIPDGARFTFNSKSYKILALSNFQTHTEIQC